MPTQYLAKLVDEECEYKHWYEPSWPELARAAVAVGEGEVRTEDIFWSPTFDLAYSPGLSARAVKRGAEKSWLEAVPIASSSEKALHASPGNFYHLIWNAAAEPIALMTEKSWLETAQAAHAGYFSPGNFYNLIFDFMAEPVALDAIDDSLREAEAVLLHGPISKVDQDYSAILNAIEISRGITHLHANWDGEGAQGYDVHTWERATAFLSRHSSFAQKRGYVIGVSSIAPADHGSIDIYWMDESRELLINIPADPNELGTYYGRKRTGDTISGVLNTDTFREDLVAWLTQNH